MSSDDCVKVIGAIASAQAVLLAALAKVYLVVRSNSRRLEAVAAAAGPGATMGEDRT